MLSIGMYGLETQEVITLHTCRWRSPLCSGLLQNPNRLPALLQPAGVLLRGYSVWKHRAFFWCLDLGAASLVPLFRKILFFNMFTMAALKPHCFSVFALSFLFLCYYWHKMFLQCVKCS